MVNRQDSFISHEIAEITFFVMFIITMGIILPLVAGFGLLAFEETFVAGRPLQFGDFLVTFLIYYILFIVSLGLIVFKIREIAITNKGEHPANQSNPKHFAVGIMHDPEQDGALYNLFDGLGLKDKRNPMRWSLSIFRTFIVAILIFGTLGLVTTLLQFQFVGIPQIGLQQITPTTEVILAAEPPATSETMTILFVFSLMLSEVAWFTSKFKLGKVGYYSIGFLLVTPAIGFLWAGFHRIVYGNQEAALFATFIFGTVGSAITLLAGSWIYFWAWHFFNNLFVKLAQVATSNEDVVFINIVWLSVLFVSWITGELLLSRFRKKKLNIPPTPD